MGVARLVLVLLLRFLGRRLTAWPGPYMFLIGPSEANSPIGMKGFSLVGVLSIAVNCVVVVKGSRAALMLDEAMNVIEDNIVLLMGI